MGSTSILPFVILQRNPAEWSSKNKSMNLAERLIVEHLDFEKKRKNMELFEIAYKEYLDSIGQEGLDPPENPDEEVPNRRLCFGGLKHQFICIDGEWTCNECGLVFSPTPPVSEYGCWDRAGVDGPDRCSVSFKFDSFCQRKSTDR